MYSGYRMYNKIAGNGLISGSAASLDRNIDSPGVKEIPTPRRYDSDIEVISNPSQSSIEVLEVHGRYVIIIFC